LDLKGRVRSLERRHADRLDQLSSQDSCRGDSVLRQQLCDWSDRLRVEERTFEQIRQATRQLIEVMWNMAGDAGRATAVSRGAGNVDDEWKVSVSVLGQDNVRLLRAVCEAAS
jgi:hypothetical protein